MKHINMRELGFHYTNYSVLFSDVQLNLMLTCMLTCKQLSINEQLIEISPYDFFKIFYLYNTQKIKNLILF